MSFARLYRESLTLKYMLMLLAISLVPLIGITVLDLGRSRKALREITVMHLQGVSLSKEAQLDNWIEEKKRSLREFAARQTLEYLAQLLATEPSISAQFKLARDELVERHFYPMMDTEGWALELFILSSDTGEILASTDGDHEGMYVDWQPYFVEGRRETYVQNPYYSLLLEQPAMTMATPVNGLDGDRCAVLAARLNLNEISAIMRQGGGLSESEESYLVNKSNFFVTESRFEPDYSLRRAIYTEGVQSALHGKDGVGLYEDYRGVSVIGVYRWLPRWEMVILTEVDQVEAFASMQELRRALAMIGLATGLLVMLVALLMSRAITKPIRRLKEGTHQVGSGNLRYRIHLKRSDEIGGLASAFNRMAENLIEVMASRDELMREISERERAESAVRESKEELQTIYDGMVDGVLVIRADTRQIVRVNASLCNLLQLEEEELLRKSLADIHPAEGLKLVERMISACEKQGQASRENVRCSSRRDEQVYADIGSSLIVYQSHRAMVCFYRDSTERKLYEDGLKTMAASMAHEIRNPLNSIATGIDLISRSGNGKNERAFTGIREESRRIYRLLSDFLRFSSPYVPSIKLWDLNHVLMEVVSLLKSDKQASGVSFNTELDEKIGHIPFDRDKLRQVFWNLVLNAIYSLSGSGAVTITSFRGADYVTIVVSDDGCGIADSDLRRIFEPFFTTKPKGTGLGLAIANKIIKHHEGTIDIESTVGNGTRCVVRLPTRM